MLNDRVRFLLHIRRQIIDIDWIPFWSRPQDHKPALSQEWCQNTGVIADEAGVAVDAIKAWGKELMGWWLG